MRGVATRGASNAPQMAADARAQDGPGSGAFAEGAQERGRQDEDDCWTSGDDGDAGDPARALQSEPDPRLDPGGLCFAARAPASPASGRLGPWEGEAERPSSYHDAEESRASWLPSPVSLQVDQTLVVSPEAPETKTPVQQSADMLYQGAAKGAWSQSARMRICMTDAGACLAGFCPWRATAGPGRQRVRRSDRDARCSMRLIRLILTCARAWAVAADLCSVGRLQDAEVLHASCLLGCPWSTCLEWWRR